MAGTTPGGTTVPETDAAPWRTTGPGRLSASGPGMAQVVLVVRLAAAMAITGHGGTGAGDTGGSGTMSPDGTTDPDSGSTPDLMAQVVLVV